MAALTSAYIVSKGSANYWVNIHVPKAFYWSTAFIVASSVFIQLALVMARRGDTARIPLLLLFTLLLGIGFTVNQFKGWKQLHDLGYFFSFSKVLEPSGVYGVDYTIEHQGVKLDRVNTEFFMPDDTAHAKPLNADMEDQVNGASQYFYILTWAHLAHLAGGLIAVLVLLLRSLRRRYTAAAHVGLWQGTLYWHFLGILWIYLLSFLMFVH